MSDRKLSLDGREVGQALNALRRTITRPCGECGVEITGVSTIKWCSPRCAKRHERRMKRQRHSRVTAFLRTSKAS